MTSFVLLFGTCNHVHEVLVQLVIYKEFKKIATKQLIIVINNVPLKLSIVI